MAKIDISNGKDQRRRLVEQVASSSYFSKSARLREMFAYVCDRVLDHEVDEIHEQEVGRRVFGRPADYDTSADNTVRVHASMLRKRVDQYFATEGSSEPIVIEIPRGNYAPVFRERPAKPAPLELIPQPATPAPAESAVYVKRPGWHIWLPAAAAVLFAALSLGLYLQIRRIQKPGVLASEPTVRQFWSQVFQANRPTDVVLGDGALALFEERTDRPVALSEYFDRSYLNKSGDRATAAKIDPDWAKVLLLKRQTSYGDVALLSQITDMARAEKSDTRVRFARDYTFREIKSNNIVLLGNIGSNPWIEPFQEHQTLRWKFDNILGNYYPIDTKLAPSDMEKYHTIVQPGEPPVGYAIVSLFPNMGGTGTVLSISGTGGSAMTGALGFLSDDRLMSQLHAQLNAGAKEPFP
ncbi:MAG TPA: hypothetical protein VGH55_01620, partial [Chthoniobacterales bacterium]